MALQTKTFTSPTTSNGFSLSLILKENSIDVNNNFSKGDYTLVLKSGNAYFSQYKIGWSVSLDGSVISSQPKATAGQREISKNSSLKLI